MENVEENYLLSAKQLLFVAHLNWGRAFFKFQDRFQQVDFKKNLQENKLFKGLFYQRELEFVGNKATWLIKDPFMVNILNLSSRSMRDFVIVSGFLCHKNSIVFNLNTKKDSFFESNDEFLSFSKLIKTKIDWSKLKIDLPESLQWRSYNTDIRDLFIKSGLYCICQSVFPVPDHVHEVLNMRLGNLEKEWFESRSGNETVARNLLKLVYSSRDWR